MTATETPPSPSLSLPWGGEALALDVPPEWRIEANWPKFVGPVADYPGALGRRARAGPSAVPGVVLAPRRKVAIVVDDPSALTQIGGPSYGFGAIAVSGLYADRTCRSA
jgi:hypothetical protein